MGFSPGQSGNEKGRPKGAPDKRTRFRKLLEPHAEELIGILVGQAKKGDPTALRLCVERLIPRAKSEPIDITLPETLTADSVLKLGNQVLKGIANQEMTTDEGKDMFQIIQSHMVMVEMTDLLKKITLLSEQFKKYQEGVPLLYSHNQQKINE